MNDRILWAYWENPSNVKEKPPHIELCHAIMQRAARNYDFVMVTNDTVHEYIPDIPSRIFKIRIDPVGRIDKYLRAKKRRLEAIALKVDFIRAFLLKRYGGIYIDSDAILLRDISPIFEKLEKYEFVVSRRSSQGKSHASVGFYGSIRDGNIISEYVDCLQRRLVGKLDYSWNEIGAEMLTPIVDRHREWVYNIPERVVQPITFEEAEWKFASIELQLSDVVDKDTLIFMLYSGPFKKGLAGLKREQLVDGDMLVSKAFRAALYHELEGPAPISHGAGASGL